MQVSVLTAQDIFEASRKGDITRIEQLTKINRDTVNAHDANGFTPLIIAGYRGQKDVVTYLLQAGADINASSPEGTVLLGVCYKGNTEVAKLLLDHKADVNARNQQGTTALMFAVHSDNSDLVKLLLKAGAKKDVEDKSGKTALDYAKMIHSSEIISLLSE